MLSNAYRRRWIVALGFAVLLGGQACDEATPEDDVEQEQEQEQEQPENEPTGVDIPEPEQEEVEASPGE